MLLSLRFPSVSFPRFIELGGLSLIPDKLSVTHRLCSVKTGFFSCSFLPSRPDPRARVTVARTQSEGSRSASAPAGPDPCPVPGSLLPGAAGDGSAGAPLPPEQGYVDVTRCAAAESRRPSWLIMSSSCPAGGHLAIPRRFHGGYLRGRHPAGDSLCGRTSLPPGICNSDENRPPGLHGACMER